MWKKLEQGWEIVMHSVAWTSKQYSQDSKGDPKKPQGEMSAHAILVEKNPETL